MREKCYSCGRKMIFSCGLLLFNAYCSFKNDSNIWEQKATRTPGFSLNLTPKIFFTQSCEVFWPDENQTVLMWRMLWYVCCLWILGWTFQASRSQHWKIGVSWKTTRRSEPIDCFWWVKFLLIYTKVNKRVLRSVSKCYWISFKNAARATYVSAWN